jgi:hypothetical protein
MILYHDGITHMVTADLGEDLTVAENCIVICSGGDYGDWFIYIHKQHWPKLSRALKEHYSVPEEPEVLSMVEKAFKGRKGLYEEIGEFLERAGVPHKTDVWMSGRD